MSDSGELAIGSDAEATRIPVLFGFVTLVPSVRLKFVVYMFVQCKYLFFFVLHI